jgi:OOP family OmpA-OmpF porin
MNKSKGSDLKLIPAVFAAILFATACSTPPPAEPLQDWDGDGVFEPFDQCPSTTADALVGDDGCPVDTDGDGVPDYLDKCPDTLPGAAACAYGCALGAAIVINLVNDEFDFDKAILKPDMKTALDNVIMMISSEDEPVDLTVVGHTDSTGSEAYNLDLSLRRAQAVVDYLRANGLRDQAFEKIGKGESEPVDSNDTPQGQAKNRRVEIFAHSAEQH